jgi:hypothetical protein
MTIPSLWSPGPTKESVFKVEGCIAAVLLASFRLDETLYICGGRR